MAATIDPNAAEIARLDSELAKARAELAQLAPLRNVLRSWAWQDIAGAGRIADTDCERQVITAFAQAEKAKEVGRG